MNIDGLEIEDYIYHFLREMNDLYSFEGKNVIFLNYSPDVNNARLILKRGAEKVFFANPDFSFQEIEDGKIILTGSEAKDLENLEDNSADLVIGLDFLEHINNPKEYFRELKRIVKPTGNIEIQGNPMWTSHYGHHLWIENKYNFCDGTNPFVNWEHLVYNSKQEMTDALINKGYSEADSTEITEWIFNPLEINRLSPTEIINAVIGTSLDNAQKTELAFSVIYQYKDSKYEYIIRQCFNKEQPNEFFEKAKEKYSEHDLKTIRMVFKCNPIDNPVNKQYFDVETNNIEGLSDYLFDFVKDFAKKYNVYGKTVLNISLQERAAVSELFGKLGAKKVYTLFANDVSCSSNVIKDVDIVFGLDSLIYIDNADEFFEAVKNIIKDDTLIYLTGYNPYTNANWIKVHRDINIPQWSCLTAETKEDFRQLLLKNGYTDAENISEKFITNNDKILKLSPTELHNTANNYINLYLRRIFKYYEPNEYYYKALEKYSEDDLNTHKIILTNDFPTANEFNKLELNKYLLENISDINARYGFKGKRILNVTPQINQQISEALEAFEAKEVVSLYEYYDSGLELKGGRNIKCVAHDLENLEYITGKFDIIYGLDILEHVKDVRRFFANLRNLITDKGEICIQGSPLWPSYRGHNCNLLLDCGTLQTAENGLALRPWEHLAYSTKEELKTAMLERGFTENDAEKASEFIINSNEINRKSYAEFLDILGEFDDLQFGAKKILQDTDENEFYEIANKKYTHEELRTIELKLVIRKK